VASYDVNPVGVEHCRRMVESRQYVLDSDWGQRQPDAAAQNAYLESHSWEAFVVGDFRRVHRTALIACVYRAAEWRHKRVELAAHELLQLLDARSGLTAGDDGT
jgi:hypothetical protein